MTESLPPITHEGLRTPGKLRAPQRHRRALAALPGSYPSPNFSSRGGTKVTGIVIHTAEGILDANDLGVFFAQPSRQASSHVGIDDVKTVAYVDPQFEAWTLRNGNPWTENAEMCGFAHWTGADWAQHPGIVQQAAAWVAARCKANGIPPKRITADDIKAGRRTGYFAHWDYTLATGDGTHWDVGLGFPWAAFDVLVQAAYNPAPTPAPIQEDTVKTYHNVATGEVVQCGLNFWKHVPSPAYLKMLLARGLASEPVEDVSDAEFQFYKQFYGPPAAPAPAPSPAPVTPPAA